MRRTRTHTHVPLKQAVGRVLLGARVGGNTEQEINMLKKHGRACCAFNF